MASDARVHRFSTAEFERMVHSGVLDELRVELIDGLVIDVSPPSEPHSRAIQNVMRLCAGRMDLLRVQMPLAVTDGWVPEPDVALVEPSPDPTRWPSTALLAVEIAVSFRALDRRKAPAYARAGVPTYWLIDLPREILLEHTEPGHGGYEVVSRLAGDDVLDAGVEGIRTTTVAELLTL